MQNDSKVHQLLDGFGELPTLPTVLHRINALLSNPRTTAAEVGQAISTDQAIAAKIIRLVNSALYGFPGRISTISHAIVILGFSTVKSIILTTSILSQFNLRAKINGFDVTGLWKHSLATGCLAKLIASEIGYRGKEEAFVGGLLHDLGKAVHALYLPDDFVQLVNKAHERHLWIHEVEMDRHGVSHIDIGAAIAERWNLPADLRACINFHHIPMSAGNHIQLAAITHIADIMARGLCIGTPGDPSMPLVDIQAWELLKLDETKINNVLMRFDKEMEQNSIFLSIND